MGFLLLYLIHAAATQLVLRTTLFTLTSGVLPERGRKNGPVGAGRGSWFSTDELCQGDKGPVPPLEACSGFLLR